MRKLENLKTDAFKGRIAVSKHPEACMQFVGFKKTFESTSEDCKREVENTFRKPRKGGCGSNRRASEEGKVA